jgi:hypothetical protein
MSIWEQGYYRMPVEKGLLLLSSFCPEKTQAELAGLSIGRRDALLLSLQEQLFGPRMEGLATCPLCSQRLEMSFSALEIRVNPENVPERELSVGIDEYEVHFRLPNSLDLMAISDLDDLDVATQALTGRCLMGVSHQGVEISSDLLPEVVLNAAQEMMTQADPQADVQIALCCPACEHKWQEAFDILSFLWEEIDAWVYRTLNDVHVLASAYGWSESEILAMSAWKRQAYLDLVSQ